MLQARGLRWTPQRRDILTILDETDGHITGAELVERCRVRDPETTPSTVYRTLDVLEELGVVRHSHGPDGREEFHVRPESEHGHVVCERCGASFDLDPVEAAPLVQTLRQRRGFTADVSHLTVVGQCRECGDQGTAAIPDR